MASSSTTPNDSPRSDGAQNTSAPRSRAAISSSLEPAQPLDAGVAAVAGPQRLGLGARRRHPQPRRRRGRQAQGVEQHGQALARLVAADEEDRRARRSGSGVGLGEPLDLDAVEQQLVVAAERPCGAVAGRPPTPRTARSSRRGQPAHARAGPAGRRRCRPRRGTCRRSGRCGTAASSCVGPGASGSCRWSDVERLVAQGPDRAQLGRRGRAPAGRPSRWPRSARCCRAASRRRRAAGRRTGPSTRTSWPSARSARARPSTWRLHAAGDGQAVGADQPDAHGVNVTARSSRSPGAERRLRAGPAPIRRGRWASSAA